MFTRSELCYNYFTSVTHAHIHTRTHVIIDNYMSYLFFFYQEKIDILQYFQNDDRDTYEL